MTAAVAGLSLSATRSAVAQASPNHEAMLQQLGPDPFVAPTESLVQLVRQAPAAVVADIVKRGELKLHSGSGFAAYRVVIRDVVYNKSQTSGPPLEVGSEVEFIQSVGREQARAFLANRIPVAPRDECLLFLWLQPGGRTWQILSWMVQFRKSRKVAGAADSLSPPGAGEWMDARWLGASLALSVIPDGHQVRPEWAALVQEVRRLGAQP
jgi:hypothetical protein